MRRVLTPSLALGFVLGAASSPAAAAAASYETEEIAILRAIVAHARRPAGHPVCIDLHLRGQLPSAATLARQWVRDARQARAPGFERSERALARHPGRTAAADRDLDVRELAGAGETSGSVVDRCPAQEWFTIWRPVLLPGSALVSISAGSACTSRSLSLALRKRGRVWLVEGEYSFTVPDGIGCGQAYPGQQAAAGRYLLVGG